VTAAALVNSRPARRAHPPRSRPDAGPDEVRGRQAVLASL